MDRKQTIIKAFGDTLRDFGYRNLTDAQVETAITSVVKGEAKGVIAGWISRWLEGEFADLKPECEVLFKEV